MNTRTATPWALVLAAMFGGGPACKRLEHSPLGNTEGTPPLSAPAPTAPARSAAAPALAAPAASDDDDGDDGDGIAPPTAGGRRASASTPGRRRRARDGSSHGSEPGGAAPEPSGGDPYDADLKLTRLVVSKGIAGREPVGAATTFHASDAERIYAFVELTNDSKIKDEIYVTFAPVGGGPQHRVKLEVGAEPRWRTWAFTRRPKSPGAWTAVVKTSSGRVLGSTSFEVKP